MGEDSCVLGDRGNHGAVIGPRKYLHSSVIPWVCWQMADSQGQRELGVRIQRQVPVLTLNAPWGLEVLGRWLSG